MISHTGHIMTLANSIIGVGILAMPFCFQRCGVILAILLLIINNLITRISCNYLIKTSVITRKRSFEFLAFHTFGSSGKLMIELCIIGYLLGTCIAYFVVIGDLGPQIIAKILNIQETSRLRTWTMIVVTFCCIIPLGLLKNVDSLSTVCTASIGFYFCLVLKVISESISYFVNNHWTKSIDYWKPSGILQCLPICSMALACQIQLFEVLATLPSPSTDKMRHVVNTATIICTYVYIFVGFFGYVAFNTHSLSGNILVHLSPSLVSDAIKMGFVLSTAFSFPLVVFPCRASIYSLFYRKGYTDSSGYIPEFRFKVITIIIILFSLTIGLLIPSIELVIGLVGSTIGIAVCVMFPALCFIKIIKKDTSEKSLAQAMIVGGFCLMILGTYVNLNAIDEKHSGLATNDEHSVGLQNIKHKNLSLNNLKTKEKLTTSSSSTTTPPPPPPPVVDDQQNKLIKQKQNHHNYQQQNQQKYIENQIKEQQLKKQEQLKISNDLHRKKLLKNEQNVEIKVSNLVENVKIDNNNQKNIVKRIEENAIGIVSESVAEIDKDAIKKEDEITAEEESKVNQKKSLNNTNNNNSNNNVDDKNKNDKKQENIAAVELEKTKVLLEKRVDELKEQLAKQNVETQNLVVEKLDDIVQKVQQIEKQMNIDNINKKQLMKSENMPENNIEKQQQQKEKENLNDNNNNNNKKIIKEQQHNEENKIEINNKKINDLMDVQNYGNKLNLSSLIKMNEIKNISMNSQQQQQIVNDKLELKKQINQTQMKQPLPLPLLLNASVTVNNTIILNSEKLKTNNNNNNQNDDHKSIENIKQINENFDQKTKDKINSHNNIIVNQQITEEKSQEIQRNHIENNEKNNIESIRRDLLEVVTNKNDEITTNIVHDNNNNLKKSPSEKLIGKNLISSSNMNREKRDIQETKNSCINWDLFKDDCLDNKINNSILNLNSLINLNEKNIQLTGRELKSIKE